ncbi:MAG: hypothetical protein V4735_05695 [Pseudomonadota bacterium]
MRKYIIIALVLLVSGIAISLYVLPTAGEVAATQNRGAQTVDLSTTDVEAEYTQGNRSYPIVAALADKRVAAGDRPAAITLLEEYVTANPADVNGRKKLAEQYQLAGNQAGYSLQLEEIAKAAPTEDNLRVLSDIYNANKDYPKQAAVLQRIIDVTEGKKPEAFVDLATIQVVIGDTDGALKTVEALKVKHPTFSSYPMTRIMVSVLADKGRVDEAFKAAQEWVNSPSAPVPSPLPAPIPAPVAPTADGAAPLLQTDPRPAQLADLCNILNYSGHPDKAVALVEPHVAMLDTNIDLVVAYVNANINAGRADHAYAILQKMDVAGKMTPLLYQPYLDLAIKREDMAEAQAIATKLDVQLFTEEQALNIIEVARANNAPAIVTTLTTRFNDAVVLEGKPVLAAVIAILSNDKAQDARIETALNTQLGSTQRIRLAESCARAKKTACFEAILKQFPALDAMAPNQIAEYAQLFIIAERAGELVDPVGAKAALPDAHADVVIAHHRLAAASGRMDVLKPWLEAKANIVPASQLQELFYLANDRHHGDVAMDIAERLYARDPSPMNRDIMTNGYITAGAYDKALPLLREQVKDSGANDGLYISTLSKMARKDANARKELADYAEAALRAGRGDARQQLNYAYVMINNGRKDAVIPIAKGYASERGGEWKKMYAQLTQKASYKASGLPVKLTREQLVAMSSSPTISQSNKRQIAFQLLNDGHKADAVVLFKELAKDKGPDSQEVKDLVYLWGGKLNSEQLAWVQQRAASANAYDKQRWSEIIGNTATDGDLMQYVSTTPEALYNRPLRQKYFRMLASSGNRSNYDVAMRGWVAQTTDVPALLDYASAAQAYGFRDAAVSGYARVLALEPTNAKALSQSAALDFSKGKFSAADHNLDQYLYTQSQTATPDAESNPAQAHFYKAELHRREGNMPAALMEYNQVVVLTPAASTTAPDALSRLYTSQFRLGQHAQAKAGFNELLAQYPDNKGVLADYMSALIEYHYVDEATKIANQYDKNSPYYQKGVSLQGMSAHVASVERLSGGRELRIGFNKPIEGTSPINLAKADQLAWLQGSETGYDSMTISAKPGYVVRYVPTAEQQFMVVPAAEPNYSPLVEEQRQQDLRLQLLYARIEQDSGQPDKAQERVTALKQYYPQDPQLLSYEASLASAAGNRTQAIQLVEQARRVAPENEGLTLQAQNITSTGNAASPEANYVKLDHQYRGLGENDEQITTLSTIVHSRSGAEIGANVQNDYFNTHRTRAADDGRVRNYDGTRQRGELYAAYNFADGERAQASLFSNNKALGGGAYYDFTTELGRTKLIGEYKRPYWDFIEAVYEHATRDRVGFTHYANLTPTTSLGLEASYNNYGTDLQMDVAQTALVRANLIQEIQPMTATQPYLGVGYGFDGEYITGGKPDSRTDAFGTEYYLLPVRTREVHALTGIYRDDWTPTTHALLVGGAAYDRINGGFSPLAEAHIDQDIAENWQVGARARYAQETNNTDNQALDVGADIIYKF